jgi:hypothetical protein
MTEVGPDTVAALRREQRLFGSAVVGLIALVVAGMVALVTHGVEPRLAGPSWAAVGGLLARPLVLYRRHRLRRIGLTSDQADAAIRADRERRTGLAEMSAFERSLHEGQRATAWFASGAGLLVLGALSMAYAVVQFGKPVESGAADSPWTAVSFFGALVAGIVGLGALGGGWTHHVAARHWRARDHGVGGPNRSSSSGTATSRQKPEATSPPDIPAVG